MLDEHPFSLKKRIAFTPNIFFYYGFESWHIKPILGYLLLNIKNAITLVTCTVSENATFQPKMQ